MYSEIIQLALPQFLESDRLTALKEKEKGEPYLPLSLTRMETASWYLDHPHEPVIDPRRKTTQQHINILSGLAFHDIVRLTSLWRTAQPCYKSYNYSETYQENLNQIVNKIPTAKAPTVRLLYTMLDDERLALPKVRQHQQAKRKIYEILTDKVISWMRSVQPFTDTPAFPQLNADPRLVGEIPFPNPQALNSTWDQQQQTQIIHQHVDNLFHYQEEQTIMPTDYARHGNNNYFSELRLFSLLHKYGVVWTTRLDEVTVGKAQQMPNAKITVTDYKLNQVINYPEKTSLYQRLALRLATWLTAQSVIALAQQNNLEEFAFEPNGCAIQINISPTSNPDIGIDIINLGFATYPPSELNLSSYLQPFWVFEGRSWQTDTALGQFTQMIRNNMERLAPIFS